MVAASRPRFSLKLAALATGIVLLGSSLSGVQGGDIYAWVEDWEHDALVATTSFTELEGDRPQSSGTAGEAEVLAGVIKAHRQNLHGQLSSLGELTSECYNRLDSYLGSKLESMRRYVEQSGVPGLGKLFDKIESGWTGLGPDSQVLKKLGGLGSTASVIIRAKQLLGSRKPSSQRLSSFLEVDEAGSLVAKVNDDWTELERSVEQAVSSAGEADSSPSSSSFREVSRHGENDEASASPSFVSEGSSANMMTTVGVMNRDEANELAALFLEIHRQQVDHESAAGHTEGEANEPVGLSESELLGIASHPEDSNLVFLHVHEQFFSKLWSKVTQKSKEGIEAIGQKLSEEVVSTEKGSSVLDRLKDGFMNGASKLVKSAVDKVSQWAGKSDLGQWILGGVGKLGANPKVQRWLDKLGPLGGPLKEAQRMLEEKFSVGGGCPPSNGEAGHENGPEEELGDSFDGGSGPDTENRDDFSSESHPE